jgi:hypothetical protein
MYQPKGSSTATGPSHQGEEQCQQQEPVDQDVAKPHDLRMAGLLRMETRPRRSKLKILPRRNLEGLAAVC